MEFRCRVATASGQVSEASFVAENEARLRAELEEKGLHLLSVRHAGGLRVGRVRLGTPRRRRVPTAEFLVFNQELATLLKARGRFDPPTRSSWFYSGGNGLDGKVSTFRWYDPRQIDATGRQVDAGLAAR